jgi:transcriptional regulator with XRE-family HTH domain
MDFSMSNKQIPRLRQERERRGWSREYLAEHVQVDVVTVGRWERGQRLPHPIYRQKLCDLFEMNAEQLGLFLEPSQEREEDAMDLDRSSPTNVFIGESGPQADGDASDTWKTRNAAADSSQPKLTPPQETTKGKISRKTWRSSRLAHLPKRNLLVALTILLLVVVVGFGVRSCMVFSPLASCPPSCTHPINSCPKSLVEGAHNAWVKVLQYRLNYDLGSNLPVDGSFGSATKAAVTTFQSRAGISGGGGVVGERTWAAMGFCLGFSNIIRTSGTTTLANCPPGQGNGDRDTSTFVQAIQDLLNIDFYTSVFPDSPDSFPAFLTSDGSFGLQTQHAVTDFQDALGISRGGGAVGQRTWSELGMCS